MWEPVDELNDNSLCESSRRCEGGMSVCGPLIDVLREPAEALAVALSLQHAAHKHLQGSRVQLFEGNVALSRRLTVQSKHLAQLLLTNGFRFVDLVAEDQDGHISNGFICH